VTKEFKKTYGDLEVVVLKSRCIGASVCVHEARGSFELEKGHQAVITDLSKNKEATLVAAARNCPTQAIFIYKNNKQIWPPPGRHGITLQPSPDPKMKFE
jgi:ferredoxin